MYKLTSVWMDLQSVQCYKEQQQQMPSKAMCVCDGCCCWWMGEWEFG